MLFILELKRRPSEPAFDVGYVTVPRQHRRLTGTVISPNEVSPPGVYIFLLLQRANERNDIIHLRLGQAGDGFHLALARRNDFLEISIRLGLDFL